MSVDDECPQQRGILYLFDILLMDCLIFIATFFSFSYLISIAGTLNIILCVIGMSGYLCFVPDLRGITLSFSCLLNC